MNIKLLLTTAAARVRENTPLIVTATAIAGVVATSVLVAKAAPKAAEAVEEDYQPGDSKYTPVQYVKTTWKIWLPAVGSGALTIAAIVLIHTSHKRRYGALMGLYVLGDKAFTEWRESAEEVIDESTMTKVKAKVAEKAMSRDESLLDEQSGIMQNETLCTDMYSGRFFRCDMETIRRAENDFNQDLISFMAGSLNEFYSKIGLDNIQAGEDVGWNSDHLMDLNYNSILTPNGTPALCIDFYNSPPKFNYFSNH